MSLWHQAGIVARAARIRIAPMVNLVTLLLMHGLLVLMFVRLLLRDDLDDDAAPPREWRKPRTARRKQQDGEAG